jgi:hypothetical protein
MGKLGALIMSTVMASLAISGCQKAAEKAAEKAIEAGMSKDGNKANVDISGGKVTIESKDGKAVYAGGKDAKVPDSFPKDVYVYEGASVTASIAMPDGFNLVMETKDSPDKVMAAVKSKMSGNSWKQEMEMNQGGSSMVTYKKGERTVAFNIAAQPKGAQISIIVSDEKSK